MRPDLSVVLLVTVPLMLISIVFIISKGFPRFAKVQTKIDSLNNTVQENITNVRVVKSFVREDFENDKFKTANRDISRDGCGRFSFSSSSRRIAEIPAGVAALPIPKRFAMIFIVMWLLSLTLGKSL